MTSLTTSDSDFVWLPVSSLAREFNKHPRTIKRWCVSGFVLTLGYRIRRDLTGHWIVGVPRSEYPGHSGRNPLQQSL